MEKTQKLMFWGSGLVMAGWSLVFLMVIKIIPTSFFLSFFAYGIFLVGFTIGMLAAYSHVRQEKERLQKIQGNPPDKQKKD